MIRASRLLPAIAAILCGQLVLVSCSTPSNEAAAPQGQPARFPQTPEILAMEKKVAADPVVLQVLGRRPGSRVKLRKLEQMITAYVVEQRGGKWFNVSRELPPADLAAISAAVRRAAGTSGQWEIVDLQGR